MEGLRARAIALPYLPDSDFLNISINSRRTVCVAVVIIKCILQIFALTCALWYDIIIKICVRLLPAAGIVNAKV